MKKLFAVIFKTVFLIFTAYLITAKSQNPTGAVVSENWGVSTTCPNATANNETMTLGHDGVITDPPHRSFLGYGLPVSYVRPGKDKYIAGRVNNMIRECNYSSQEDGTSEKTLRIYSCMENNVAVCVVTFSPL